MAYSFKDIKAWQKSYELVLLVYQATRHFPDFEKYGLASQFQRTAVSIIANIAEGSKKLSKADKLRFMNIAQGSLEECRCYIMLSKDLQYVKENEYEILENHVNNASFLLNAYCKAIVENKGVHDE